MEALKSTVRICIIYRCYRAEIGSLLAYLLLSLRLSLAAFPLSFIDIVRRPASRSIDVVQSGSSSRPRKQRMNFSQRRSKRFSSWGSRLPQTSLDSTLSARYVQPSVCLPVCLPIFVRCLAILCPLPIAHCPLPMARGVA